MLTVPEVSFAVPSAGIRNLIIRYHKAWRRYLKEKPSSGRCQFSLGITTAIPQIITLLF